MDLAKIILTVAMLAKVAVYVWAFVAIRKSNRAVRIAQIQLQARSMTKGWTDAV